MLQKKGSSRPGPSYDDVVEEALCFGWVDSRTRGLDAERTLLYVSRRRPRSRWSASNRARVERLEQAGLMHESGRAAVARAKADGLWLDE